jgi:hypothetical protein
VRRMNMLTGYRKLFWNADTNSYTGVSTDDLLSLTKYGLGNKRTLDQFIAFTGIDTRNHLVFENSCVQKSWVKFIVDVVPGVDALDHWGLSPETVNANKGKSELENFIFNSNQIPLVSAGKKQRVKLLTHEMPADALKSDVHASSNNGDINAKNKAIKEKLEQQQLEYSNSLWARWFGWWVDDWILLTEQLISTQIQENAKENSVRIVRLLLLLFPFVLCVTAALCYPLVSSPGPRVRNAKVSVGVKSSDRNEVSADDESDDNEDEEEDEEEDEAVEDEEQASIYTTPRASSSAKSSKLSKKSSGKRKSSTKKAPKTPI